MDWNTKYFQRIANSHRRSNCIDKLKIESVITEGKDRTKVKILDFYQKSHTERENKRPLTWFDNLATNKNQDNIDLESAFEEEV
uniref:Uncharacterized protein n=1 Tax=Solanum tuberosum TaxID=4113 RepID=M1BT90_SOLTU